LTRLDLSASRVAASIPLDFAGGLLAVAGDHSWFFEDRGGVPVLLLVDNESNEIRQVWETDPEQPYAVVGDVMWAVDRDAGELRMVQLPTGG
jgi:hypothetical protein